MFGQKFQFIRQNIGAAFLDESGTPYGVRHTDGRPHQIAYVWNTSTLDIEIAKQTVVTVGNMTVSGTTDLTKIGGVNVGATNGMYVRPGTGATFTVDGSGATNLGKVRGATAGDSDVGVAALGVFRQDDSRTALDELDYGRLSLTHFRELRTRDQRAIDLCNCNDYTAVAVLGNDTVNLANSTNHVFGSGALTFDKANGAANTVYAGVSDTFTAVSLAEIFEAGGFVGLGVYLPSIANVVNVFLRIGTDANNYNCWTWPVATLTAATWLNLRVAAASPDYSKNTGTGWNTGSIAYVAFGVQFSAETDTLAGICFDHVHVVGGRVTASDINASVSSSVTTPNINVNRMGGVATATGNGAVNGGTQRVTIANDSTGVIANVPVATFVSTTVTLTSATTAYKLPTSEQAGRRLLVLYNCSDTDQFIGSSAVAVATGIKLAAGATMSMECSANLYAICGSAGKTINVLECK